MVEAFFARLTHLGDPLLLLLCGFGVFFYLWSANDRHELARSWAVAFGICLLLTVAGKFVLHLLRWNEGTALRLLSPSGHVAIGTGFYGICAMIIASQHGWAARVLVWTGTALLLGLIAASRLALGLHTVPEIVLAFAIGGASLAVFAVHSRNLRPIRFSSGHLVALIVLIGVAYAMPRVSGEALVLRIVRSLD